VITVLIIAVLYLIIGAAVQFKVKGARGLELIPNLEFWKDLPFLMKDGCVYTFRKLTCKSDYSAL